MAIANKKKSSKKKPFIRGDKRRKGCGNSRIFMGRHGKKFNLQPAIDLLMMMVEIIAKQINSYAALVWLNEELTKVNDEIDRVLKKSRLGFIFTTLKNQKSFPFRIRF